ncbi:uncharacterized protein LOC110385397 [Bombyx mori]|uniref:Uncharacterized protein n=1 Tax=Bombyx mori TaxID=7091 RepID=A0A8R2HN55_BOMMO|nr:uncharacterized protein LOC110385397 isoform X1 [Bombyx mori]XP_037872733.1 uncharacterized protein LOC110385397 isoform X1 [Bombyx mori]
MIELPKIERNVNNTQDLCKCRPICKSRRREWKGQVQQTSAELLLESKPKVDCLRKWPKLSPDSPCPLSGRTRVAMKQTITRRPEIVRICEAPIESTADTTYLQHLEMARKIGALRTVKMCCAFCRCGACCPCTASEYAPRDAERTNQRLSDMRSFDMRVKTDSLQMRIMYN